MPWGRITLTDLRATVPRIDPSEGSRPLWSVMIPTYNCAQLLEQTLASVLSQAPGPDRMQIEVVDDHSLQDDPEAVVLRVAGDRVGFFRQPRNVGHSRNFNTCLRRARGRLVHILHGDDWVRPGFYSSMEHAFSQDPELGAAFCGVSVVDEHGSARYDVPRLQPASGRVEDAAYVMAVRQPVETPAIVVRRDVYEQLGGFREELKTCGEDLEMWVRIAADYPIWYVADCLAVYRSYSESLSGTSFRTGQNVRDCRRAIQMFQEHLPADRAMKIAAEARQVTGLWAIGIARDALGRGRYGSAWAQVREALRCGPSLPLLRAVLELGRWAAHRKARALLRRNSRGLSA
jgi:GT2 family glycosyltransferase